MTEYLVPFNRAACTGEELSYVSQAIREGHVGGNGSFGRRCEALLEEITGARRALLTTSCTHALEMCALLLEIGPGDEVLVPSFTFVSTANAFALHGARPVFVDVRRDTLNIDEEQLEARLTAHTRAVVPVHYAGVACEMDAILEIAARRGIAVVEDNAHGLFGAYRGRALGSLGCLATQSFHETKNVTCGEGGALLINDERYRERAEIIREKGTDRSRYFRGQVDKYTWVDVGSSWVQSDLLAAFLCAQLENRARIQESRRLIWTRYERDLREWAEANGVALPTVPAECRQAFHLFYLLLPSLTAREALIGHLRAAGIMGVFHYQPLHLSTMGRRFGARAGDCPVAEEASGRLLRLPLFNDLDERTQERVIEVVRSFAP